ncbi:MAG: hypothetical protein ABSG05_01410 [Candidatus Pacearchaeota archaeon]|jgi:hypothetical protein
MKDLVTLMKDESASLKMGVAMESDEECEDCPEEYSATGVSHYSLMVASGQYAQKRVEMGEAK